MSLFDIYKAIKVGKSDSLFASAVGSKLNKDAWKKGFNKWDEEWQVYGSGGSARIGSKNHIPCTGGVTYFINKTPAWGWKFYDAEDNLLATYYNIKYTAPQNAVYMMFQLDDVYGTTYNHDVCLNVSGEHDGEYVPYNG